MTAGGFGMHEMRLERADARCYSFQRGIERQLDPFLMEVGAVTRTKDGVLERIHPALRDYYRTLIRAG